MCCLASRGLLWLLLVAALWHPGGGLPDPAAPLNGAGADNPGGPVLRPITGTLPGRFYLYSRKLLNYSHLLRHINWPNVSAPWNPRYQLEYMPEVFIFQALRNHPLRTHDPKQASVFIVPLLITVSHLAARCQWNNYHADHRPSCEIHWQRLRASAAALQATPHWQARRGADHVVLCHHWQCLWDGSYTGPLHKVFRQSIVYLFEGTGTIAVNNDWCRKAHCVPMGQAHPVLPYVDNPHRWRVSRLTDSYPRTHAVFFSGNCNRSVWYNVRPYMAVLRREVATQRPPLENWTLVDYRWQPTPQWSAEQMLRAKFCLCPAGDSSTSARIYFSIAAGCIPVIISDPDIRRSLPFRRLLDWRRFALFVTDTAFRAGPLRAVQAVLQGASYVSLQRALVEVQPYLTVLHPQSRVADAMVAELLLRATDPLPD